MYFFIYNNYIKKIDHRNLLIYYSTFSIIKKMKEGNIIANRYQIIGQCLDVDKLYDHITNTFKDFVADFDSSLLMKNGTPICSNNLIDKVISLDASDFSFRYIDSFMNKHLSYFTYIDNHNNDLIYPYVYKFKNIYSNHYENEIIDIYDFDYDYSKNIYIMFSRYQIHIENKIFIPAIISSHDKLQFRYLFEL